MNTVLFSPYTIKGVTLKNRIVMAPMCMYSCSQQDGMVTDFHKVHYASRAAGQTGLIMLEATSVTPQGRISNEDLGIWSDDHINGLKELTDLISQHDAKSAIQLAHAGRKSMTDGSIIAPSAIAFNENMKQPEEMSHQQIHETVQAFKDGARRSREAGFDIIELHAAHGYLINEFLSPLSNRRTDDYGGSEENRYRFLKEIIEAVNEEWSGPLFVRVSASDWHEEGLEPEDYATYAKWMKQQGVDLIDVSSGAVIPAQIHAYPGYQVPMAEVIKHKGGIDTGAVGLITSGLQAEEILQNNRADLIFIARELLRDPYWPRRAALDLQTSIEPMTQYKRGWVF
ncbi:NADPH dehydrogenase [Jeotgalibacillus alimentarius]|uniref:NADPH dehydrogenase n=1 Tax=Jeotgalibacillus alimentarius TaxID=135826 RepID=A0A0C2VYL1_9BACL|nr:NADPH dehydrogenase NamA [Jeotgalibacillus alimentarius]KIL49008.1 NADPH dehydrogenase [Jeotgalibacillus alimentarius]